ncbi:hypothetical protein P9272_24665, partial [Mesorhizobium sp. WSM4976]|uniref:hypothetical protein n=1 Tax=Mesorhizobium sp. WSM4976 TaxID=3038549 RepID=UPI002415D5F1
MGALKNRLHRLAAAKKQLGFNRLRKNRSGEAVSRLVDARSAYARVILAAVSAGFAAIGRCEVDCG